MFETVLERRRRIQRALREFADLTACRVFTQLQQLALALLCAAIGAAAALVYVAEREPAALASFKALDPVIERVDTDYSIYRLRWQLLGVEVKPCHLVAWHQTGKWTLKCW